MTAVLEAGELRERVRGGISLATLLERDGVAIRRAGAGRFSCLCPFHDERSPSFIAGGKYADRGHCFGCGWDGDIFAYHQQRRGIGFMQTLIELADMAGVMVPPELRDPSQRPSVAQPLPRRAERLGSEEITRPSLPPLRALRREECEQIAAVRGLDSVAVRYAAHAARRIGFSMWPLYESGADHEWLPRSQGCWPSWVATDETRFVAEFRRLDNERYPRIEKDPIKAWSTAGKNWPLGAASIGQRCAVLLVEGGPDMLAAYHFLMRWRMLDRVAVVCMLGASARIREDALPHFRGKRVRIMCDADDLKADGRAPGIEAAWRWQNQLQEAGAAVETFSLYGLTRPDGQPVKDVNDLALCADEVTDAAEIREAFCSWDF